MENVAVLEIGTSKLNVLVGSSGINGNFCIAGSYSIPYAGYYDGEFVDPNEINSAIKEVLSKAEIGARQQIRKLFVGVPAMFSYTFNKSFTKNLALKTKVTPELINEIYAENNEYQDRPEYVLVSCSPVSFILDDGRRTLLPLGAKTARLTGRLSYIYAEKAFIEQINVALKNYGISTVEYLSSPLSEALYLLPERKRETGRILIDCGFISTSVAVAQGNGLTLLGSFSMGGGQITSDLCECLDCSYKEAEQLKKQLILSVVPNPEENYQISRQGQAIQIPMKKANEIALARLDILGALINKCLGKNESARNQTIYLTGGGLSHIKGAKDYLSKYLGVNVEILLPVDVQYQKPEYSDVLGLLNTAIKQENKKKVNFITKFLNIFKK